MNVFELFAKLSLDTDEYDDGLDKASKKSSSFGTKLASGFKTVAKVGTAALTATTTAAVAFGATSVKAGADFDSAMSQVAATSGKTVDEIQDLRDFAQQMGSTTAFSATQAAEALNYMALAGYDADKSMEMLPNVLNLAAAGGIELGYASDMVTDAASALGLTIEETATMVDQMAMASSKSNTSVSQLGEAFLTIGATARSVAGGTTELSTVLGALADNGIKGAEGGTHLRNMILSLQSPTDEAAELLDNLGIAVYDADGNMRSMIDIIGDLQGSIDGMDNASKDAVVGGIFNKTDLAAVNALLNTSQERFDELTVAIGDSTGAAQQMADTQLDNLTGDITLFKSALEGAQIAVSDQLTPSLREFVQFGTDGISKLTTAFNEGGLDGAMEAFGEILGDGLNIIIEKLPDTLNAGMKLLEALGQSILDNLDIIIDSAVEIITMLSEGLIKALPDLVSAGCDIIIGLVDGMADAIPNLIPDIIEAVLNIAEKLIDHIDEFVDAGIELFEGLLDGIVKAIPIIVDKLPDIIIDLIDAIVECIPTLIDALVEALPELIDGAIQLVMGLVEALPEIIQALVDALPTILTAIVNGLIEALPQLIDGAIQLTILLVEHLPEIIQALIDAIPQIIESIITAFAPIVEKLGEKASEAIAKVGEFFAQLPEKLGEWASKAIEKVTEWFGKLPTKIKEKFTSVLTKVTEFGTNLKNKAQEAAKNFKDKLIDGIKAIPEKVKEIGKNIVDGLKNGIKEKWDAMVQWFTDLGDKMLGKFKSLFGIASPSKEFAKVGKFMVEGLEIGWNKEFTDFEKSLDNIDLDMNVDAQGSRTASINEKPTVIENHIYLEGDAKGIFEVVRVQNIKNTRAKGYNALATV